MGYKFELYMLRNMLRATEGCLFRSVNMYVTLYRATGMIIYCIYRTHIIAILVPTDALKQVDEPLLVVYRTGRHYSSILVLKILILQKCPTMYIQYSYQIQNDLTFDPWILVR